MSDKTTIMLAEGYNPKRLNFPVYVSEKLDGVAGDFYKKDGVIYGRTRQDKPLLASVQHIIAAMEMSGRMQDGDHIIGELYIPGLPFEEISGAVRKNQPDARIQLRVYDYYREGQEHVPYSERMSTAPHINYGPIVYITSVPIHSAEELEGYVKAFFVSNSTAEGVMIRDHSSPYEVKRSYGMQKWKQVRDIDLEVYSFEEATDKNGNPKGMVGRINVLLPKEDGTLLMVGCGPGKMGHSERTLVWENQKDYIGRTAEIHYMPSNYEALREPRFARWREDKDA